MDYSKRGIREQEKRLKNLGGRWGRKFGILVMNALVIGVIAAVIIGCSAGIGVFRGIIASAPDIGNISVTPKGFSTFVYDAEGNQTAKLVSTDSNRIPVSMDMIPDNLGNAFVSIEDERFYQHNGIDIQGIIRAAFVGARNIMSGGSPSEGASTITQQLLKNNVFTGWTSEGNNFVAKIKRKIQEQFLAIQLEKTMSKEDILLNYMNSINLGQNTLGVQAASLRYFDKPVSQLTLSECAVIAGITQNPSRFNPISHPDNNKKRRTKVLDNMLRLGYITKTEYDEAMSDDVYSRIQVVDQETEDTSINSYFVDALTNAVLQDLLAAGYNETQAYTLLYSGGLKIYSTQDPKIQAIADSVFLDPESYPEKIKYLLSYQLTIQKADGSMENHSSEKFAAYFKAQKPSFNMLFASEEDAMAAIEEYQNASLQPGDEVFDEKISLVPQPQVSMTIEEQSTGYILAMEGGRGSKTASRTLNRATDTTRQPGSTFKVLAAYAPALDSGGLTLATVFNDAPFNYDSGRPVRNWYGENYRGLTTIRTAIKDSMNIIAVKTLSVISPQLGFDYLKNFGFTTLADNETIGNKIYSDAQQALALGGITHGVKNIELNAAYATIANHGTYIKPKLYTKVVDHEGNVILDNTAPETKQVIKETTAYLLTSAMQDVVTSGTGVAVNFGTTPIAGKTGTTSDENDVWFAGFTDYYTATTWAGYDNNVDLTTNAEQHLAKTLWKKVMAKIHENLPARNFEKPAGIVSATVCSKSGQLPIAGLCDATLVTEQFAEGSVPTQTCTVHYGGSICQYDHLPASDNCPFRITGAFENAYQEPTAGGSLQQPQTMLDENGNPILDENGNPVPQEQTQQHCQHTAEFFAQPDAQQRLANQIVELQQRADAATAAGDAAQHQANQQAVNQATAASAEQAAAVQAAQEAANQAAQQNAVPAEAAPADAVPVAPEEQTAPVVETQPSGVDADGYDPFANP